MNSNQVQLVNISWTLLQLPPTANISYNLGVIWENAMHYQQDTSSSSAVFTAPEGAPPCEVYNFSVTATYDLPGAIYYTRSGCSVPSPLLSMMLPSLPDKKRLELAVKHLLEKESVMQHDIVRLRVNLLVSGNKLFMYYECL